MFALICYLIPKLNLIDKNTAMRECCKKVQFYYKQTSFFFSSAKVRRLYDIANILSSLQLIEKVHIHSIQTGRKPGFRWIGIDPNKLELVAYTQGALNNHLPLK